LQTFIQWQKIDKSKYQLFGKSKTGEFQLDIPDKPVLSYLALHRTNEIQIIFSKQPLISNTPTPTSFPAGSITISTTQSPISQEPIDIMICLDKADNVVGGVHIAPTAKLSELRVKIQQDVDDPAFKSDFFFKKSEDENVKDENLTYIKDVITSNDEVICTTQRATSDYINIYNQRGDILGAVCIDENFFGDPLRKLIIQEYPDINQNFVFLKGGRVPVSKNQEITSFSLIKSMIVSVEGERKIIVRQ